MNAKIELISKEQLLEQYICLSTQLEETEKMIRALGVKIPTRSEIKNPDAVALGRLGGLKGGRARAEKLTKEEASRIAKVAAKARWSNKPKKAKALRPNNPESPHTPLSAGQ